MTDIERDQVNERVAEVSANWPTLTENLGCIDCGFLFRRSIDGRCALCQSKSIINTSEFFNEAKLKDKREAKQNPEPAPSTLSSVGEGLNGHRDSEGTVAKAARKKGRRIEKTR